MSMGANRSFLEFDPPKNENDKISWEKFWKWLGVGWYPKVMPLLDDVVCKPQDKKGLECDKRQKVFKGAFFNKENQPDGWADYCKDLIAKASFLF